MIPSKEKVVLIDYTNWRGVRRVRRVMPVSIRFGATDWHPTEQWLMTAYDATEGAVRDEVFKRTPELREFAMKDIHSWKVEQDGA